MKKKAILLVISMVIFSASQSYAQLEILSGPKQGSYYLLVEDMKNLLGSTAERPFINQETSGAAYNFEQVADMSTRFNLALMQSDYLHLMKALDNLNNTEKTKNIKVIVPMADEEIHVVVKKSSGITSMQDLENKIVAIGSKNQGTYATATFMKERSQVNWMPQHIHFDQALKDLYDEKIHAFIMVGSSPIEKIDIDPRVMIDPVTLVNIENVNNWAQYYDSTFIYKDDYKWLEEDIATFSVKSVLIVNDAKISITDRAEIKRLINGIESNLANLKETGHPAWKKVDLTDWLESEWPMLD